MKIHINKIIIEDGADSYRGTRDILSRLSDIPAERIDNGQVDEVLTSPDMDKETLRLLPFRGEFFKPCPGTKEYICCGYNILNIGTNCPLNCSYCILQAYFNKPSLRIFVNLEEQLKPIAALLDSNPEKIFRIGTGEFTDSLALDPICNWSRLFSKFVSHTKNAVLEFKTKTDNISGLMSLESRENIIVSWSLNSAYISGKEEHRAPSIKKRLKAARKCQEEGFITGFHFDPLIYYRGWQDGYLKTIELLDKYIDPKKVIWISMGCMRFMPALKTIIRKRHNETCILDGEFIKGLDGKMRYFKPIRMEIYSWMKECLDAWDNDLGLYLCMESSDIWLKTFKWTPENSEGLSRYLDNRVTRKFLFSYQLGKV